MEEQILLGKKKLIAAAEEALKRRLLTAESAVLCERLPGENHLLITPAEVSFEHLRVDNIFLVSLNGDVLESADGCHLPADLSTYLKSFLDRSNINALGHFHPPYSYRYAAKTPLFEIMGNLTISKTGELLTVECKECPTRYTGLCSCRTDIKRHYSGAKALLLKDDGIITMAQTLDSVIQMADDIEQEARNYYITAD